MKENLHIPMEFAPGQEISGLLSAIVASSNDAIISWTLDGIITSWNTAAERIYGYSGAEAIGMPITILVPAQLPDEVAELLGRIRKGEVIESYEISRQRKDGALIEVSLTMSPIKDGAGNVTGVSSIARDITIRRRAESKFRGLLEAAPDAMVIVDQSGRMVLVNAQMEKLFGYSRGELLGQAIEMLVPQRYKQAHPGHRTGYFSNPHTRPMGMGRELFAQRKDGTEFPAEISLSPMETEEGMLTTAAIRDITLRRKSEAKFRELLEAAPDAMVIVDRTGRIELINAQTVKLFGYAREELLGQPIEMLVPNRYKGAHPGHRAGYFSNPHPRPMGMGRELYGLRKDGTEFPAEISLSPMGAEEGLLVTAAIRDMTDRKSVEEQVKKSLAEKESLLKEVHHRVKNNLQIISSLLRLQSDRVKDPEALRALLESEERVQSMALLHENLYRSGDLGRVDFRDYLQSLIGELVSAYSSAAAGVQVEAEVDRRGLDLEKAVPLGLLINEVITNALKHAFPGGRAGHVKVRLAMEGDSRAVLSVKDDGVGLPDDIEKRKASSLGLQIVETLCGQLQGTFGFRSDGGTEFHLEFPM